MAKLTNERIIRKVLRIENEITEMSNHLTFTLQESMNFLIWKSQV